MTELEKELHLNYFNETFGDPAFGLTEKQYLKIEEWLIRLFTVEN